MYLQAWCVELVQTVCGQDDFTKLMISQTLLLMFSCQLAQTLVMLHVSLSMTAMNNYVNGIHELLTEIAVCLCVCIRGGWLAGQRVPMHI